LLSLAAIAWPVTLSAQTNPDLTRILERLDRLEQENRALAAEVKSLRAELAASRETQGGTTVSVAEAPPVTPTTDEKVDIQQSRIQEMAQTKVESSQKFPLRVTGMALFNAFMNSKQSGGVDYPVVAAATGPGHDSATIRQSIVGLEFNGPTAIWGGKVQGSIYADFFSGANNSAIRIRTASIEVDWKTRTIAAGLDQGNHIIGRLVAIGLRFHAQFGISVGHLCLLNRMELHG